MDHTLHLRIELSTDATFSRRAGSVDATESLPYVPGSVLLGAAAAVLYDEILRSDWPADAWTLFHSGQVRFLPGFPVDDADRRSFPTPRALERPKVAGVSPTLRNRARVGHDDSGTQHKTIEAPFATLTDSGAFVFLEAAKRSTLRTAMDPDGRAEKGKLYGFDLLARGSRFQAAIDLSSVTDAGARTRLEGLLRRAFLGDGGARLRLGRSRSAELGEAQVTEFRPPVWSHPEAPVEAHRLVLFAETDLALVDPETGCPTLVPTAETLGLGALGVGTLDAERSSLGFRTYSPYNGKRRRFDLERQVIAQGSVLVFMSEPTVSLASVRAALAPGVGAYREDGLGCVLAEPMWLRAATLREDRRLPRTHVATPMPKGPLAAWMEGRREDARRLDEAETLARDWKKELSHYRPALPSSQWGVLRHLAMTSPACNVLFAQLFGDGTPPGERPDARKHKGAPADFDRDERRQRRAEERPSRGLLNEGVAADRKRWGKKLGDKARWQALRDCLESAPGDEIRNRALAVLASLMLRDKQQASMPEEATP